VRNVRGSDGGGHEQPLELLIYRCPPNGACERRSTISAEMVERAVVETVKTALADVEGRASAENRARETERMLEGAQRDLDAAIRLLADFSDEPADDGASCAAAWGTR
jgi:hypothetical protein